MKTSCSKQILEKGLTKGVFLYFLLLFTTLLKAQEGKINFNYDQAGNVTERKLQVLFYARLVRPSIAQDSITNKRPNFNIYPNPTNEKIIFEGNLPENTESVKLTLINTSGQTVLSDSYEGIQKQINVSNLKNGVYFLHVDLAKKESITFKVIVNK